MTENPFDPPPKHYNISCAWWLFALTVGASVWALVGALIIDYLWR